MDFEASADYVWVCKSAVFNPSVFRRHVLDGLFLNRWLKSQRQNGLDEIRFLTPEKPIRTFADACRHVHKAREIFCDSASPKELKKHIENLTYEDGLDLCQDLMEEKDGE